MTLVQTLHEYGQITPTWQIRMHETGEFAEFDLGVLERDTKHPYRLQCRQEILSQDSISESQKRFVYSHIPVEKITQDELRCMFGANKLSLMLSCNRV